MNKGKFDIKHFPDTLTTVFEHFNSPEHVIQGFFFKPVDKVNGDWKKAHERNILDLVL